MDIQFPCKPLTQLRMKTVVDFLTVHPDLFSRLPDGTHDTYLKICSTISHLRSRRSIDFFIRVLGSIEDLRENPLQAIFLRGAIWLGACNWALVLPYFKSINSLPLDEKIIEHWTLFSLSLAEWDIETALTFIEQTPNALKAFRLDEFMLWGEQAMEALKTERRVYKAAKTYLLESIADQGITPLLEWRFFLEQSIKIAKVSSSAAEVFIRLGQRVCKALNRQEMEQWVAEGLLQSRTEESLIGYFSGTFSKAIEQRNGLASGVILKEAAHVLSLICEAYLGKPVKIRDNASLVGVKGFTGRAATDGRTIYLPKVLPNFDLPKLMALHQASLIKEEGWQEKFNKSVFNPITIHLKGDRDLLERFPGLFPKMEQLAEGKLPKSYPLEYFQDLRHPLPWWGDLLPELVKETEGTLQKLRLKAEERTDLPPEVIEALLSYMMAEGQRDEKGLWERLQGIFNNFEFTSPDPEDLQECFKSFFYKEWDTRLSDYKLDWCLVRQRVAKDDPTPFVEEVNTRLHGLISLIRRQFVRLKPERFKKFRAQPMGDEIDIDALIQNFVDMRSGSFLSENVYIRRDKRTRDVAVIFLIDMSASTEEKVNGRRVIDIQKEAMVLMAEAIGSLEDPFAIFGFSSEGRFRVDLFTIKEFGEPYNERVKYRLGSMEPKQLTRLGTVIRHGICKLDGVHSLIKLMVILTDGRPYDLEYGDFNYAAADTKKALQEARQHKIHPFVITSDQKGSEYLKRICPVTMSIIVPKVEHLPFVLPAMYRRLTT